MVILVILIQHFLGILCVTKFRVTQIFEKFISWLHGHPNTITNKFQEIPQLKVFMTGIHGESHPVSTRIPITYLMTRIFHKNFHVNTVLAKLPNTSTRGFLSM